MFLEDLISVIVPTYKRPFNILKRAINSVLEQSYSSLELIVVDDSPEENINRIEIARKIKELNDNRINYIQHDYNRGACAARNTGIKYAKGEYVAFLDDDDEWLSNKLDLQIKHFNDPEVGLVCCDSYTIIMKDNIEVKKIYREIKNSGWIYESLILENIIGSTSFVMIKKEVLISSGFFNEELSSAQDYDLWLRISKRYKVAKVNMPLVNYYIHDEERISSNVDNKIQGLEKINELNKNYLVRNSKANSIRLLKIVPLYNKKYGYKRALSKWYEATKIYPFQVENFKYLAKITLYSIRELFKK